MRRQIEMLDRMLWTRAHADHVETGRQARAWLRALARRMKQIETSFSAAFGGHDRELEATLETARRVARRFLAPDPPKHLIDLRELARSPWGRWEYVSWWSGMAKMSHRLPRTSLGVLVGGVRDALRKVVRGS